MRKVIVAATVDEAVEEFRAFVEEHSPTYKLIKPVTKAFIVEVAEK